jgi:hypothetical protein
MKESADLRSIGLEIVRAMEFMRGVHSEVQSVLKDIERQFERIGLKSANFKVIFLDDSSVNIDAPRAWVQASMARIFSRGAHASPSDEYVFVEVHLEPWSRIDEPFLLVAHVTLDSPRPPNEQCMAYSASEWIASLLPAESQLGETHEVSSTEGKVLKGAKRIRFTTWPLTSMTSSQEIQRLVVEPLKAQLRGSTSKR